MATEVIVINGEVSPQSGTQVHPVSTVLGNGSDLLLDAWGRQKVIHDHSLLHTLFTFSVQNRMWEEASVDSGNLFTPLPQLGTYTNSINNMLEITSGTVANEGSSVYTKRNPGYQPNRGHLYSTACMMPNAEKDGIRRFGLHEVHNGVYFELVGDGESWTMWAVRLTNAAVQFREQVNVPEGFDPEKGHVYDIQYQWRGVGNYKFFIDLQLVAFDNALGTLTELSLRTPALPAAFECLNGPTGTDLKIKCGCVDITTEGGRREDRMFASVSTGSTLINTSNSGTATLAVYIPRTLDYNGAEVINTRDLIASKLSSWTRDEAALQVYIGRDISIPNLTNLVWETVVDSSTLFLVGGTSSNLDTAFQLDKANTRLVLNEFEEIEIKNVITNPDANMSPFYITPGDIMIVVVQPLGNNKENVSTLYLSEAI